MPTLFNNCSCRKHAKLFGPNAFYDLYRHGAQAAKAAHLRPGDECVVATPDNSGNVEFGWFSFSHESTLPAEDGEHVRVLFGERLRTETLPKHAAASTDPYSVLFNVNGHFKRVTTIEHGDGRR